jgi:WD40 repeat protein
VQQPVFSPDRKTLYTASHDGTAIAWDIDGLGVLGRPFRFTHGRAAQEPNQHPGRFSPDGQLIAVGLKKEGIQLWDASELTPTGAPLLETGGEVKSLAFSPDGRTLAAGTSSGKATVWDVASRSLRRGPFQASADEADTGVSFGADGTLLATAAVGAGVKLWDVATGAALGSIGHGRPTRAVAFSPTAPLIALVREGGFHSDAREVNAEIWDVTRRSLVSALRVRPGDRPYALGLAVGFSPDGRTLASGGVDAHVHLWDVEHGTLIRELRQNVGGVLTLDFSRDGSVLAISGYGEPFVSIWDVATGVQIGPRFTSGSDSAMVDVSPDGRRLLQTHGNGEGAVWDIDPQSWARRACTLANRTLTREEWEKFLPGRPYEPACAT